MKMDVVIARINELARKAKTEPLTEEELAKLHNSAKVLKDLMAGLDI